MTEATSPAEKTSNEETMGSNEQFGINHGNIHQGDAEEVTYTGILHSYWSILSQPAGSAAPFLSQPTRPPRHPETEAAMAGRNSDSPTKRGFLTPKGKNSEIS